MERGVTRRRFLQAIAAGGGTGLAGRGRAQQAAEPDGFAPTRHGFGFRNWSPRSQYFDDPPDPTQPAIRETIRTGWRDQFDVVLDLDTTVLPAPLVDAIATHLRTLVVQLAGTNGHCYGMVLSAQRYFEQPETIPVDRPTASDIEDPTVPIDRPEAPVYADIVDLQAAQFLRFRAWLGRRAILHPNWIDTRAVVDDVRSVVEADGTASLLLFNDSLYGHQVLAYDSRARDDGVVIAVYDPNRTAASYRDGRSVLQFVREGNGLSMQPYRGYTGALFNRYDRIERATGRRDAGPLDHLRVDRATVRASLFPVVLVLVDTEAVDLVVVDPEGAPLERLRGTHMDRTRGEAARMRARYGAVPGTYRISVLGNRRTEYEVEVNVSGLDGEIVHAGHAAGIRAGAVHEYELVVPESGVGSLSRVGGGTRLAGLVGGAGALGGVAAGALGYRFLDGRHRGRGIEEPDQRSGPSD